MDPKLEERLYALERKIDRVDKIVTKMRAVQRNANMIRAAYWVFLILLGFGAFYFIKPVFNQLKEAYGFGPSNSDSQNVNNIIDQFKSLQE